jgi:uncharacterized protein (DUF952 family)
VETIYHITRASNWQRALLVGCYTSPSLGDAGFIHCSLRHQLLSVANSHFHAAKDLVLLHVEPGRLNAEVRYGNLSGGANLFPHVYGCIPCSAVRHVTRFIPSDDGSFTEATLP